MVTAIVDAAPSATRPEKVSCERCDAVCCRLTVVLMPEDSVPEHYTDYTDAGLHVMAQDAEGWCVAVDSHHLHCTIYEDRPSICRRFSMGGPYCREVRRDYQDHMRKGIPLTMYR